NSGTTRPLLPCLPLHRLHLYLHQNLHLQRQRQSPWSQESDLSLLSFNRTSPKRSAIPLLLNKDQTRVLCAWQSRVNCRLPSMPATFNPSFSWLSRETFPRPKQSLRRFQRKPSPILSLEKQRRGCGSTSGPSSGTPKGQPP